jgi:ABC-type transport system involved in cytochrome bd biosynthesis fused ATPase/permease subunit
MNMLVSDFRDTTRIVVTHNVDHKKFADNVIVLENGTVRKDVS